MDNMVYLFCSAMKQLDTDETPEEAKAFLAMAFRAVRIKANAFVNSESDAISLTHKEMEIVVRISVRDGITIGTVTFTGYTQRIIISCTSYEHSTSKEYALNVIPN